MNPKIVRCIASPCGLVEREANQGLGLVSADVESVGDVLTDYERPADFIPNLVCSGRIPCPDPRRIWVEQRRQQRELYWHIEARVVLDLQGVPDSASGGELHFSMVDGDFKKFEGKWSVISCPRSLTTLSYEVSVIPRFSFPAIFLERIIRSDLPVNLLAIACRAERNYAGIEKPPPVGAALFPSSFMEFSDDSSESDKLLPKEFKETNPSSSIGALAASSLISNKWRFFGNTCRLGRPCIVDEVHLRVFDGLLENGGVHRGGVGSITVKAPVCEVWNVLTDYEALPDLFPQEGCKGLFYMVLHTCVVLDLYERLEQETILEQVEGNFDSFQGKWLLEQLGNHHTLLKYIVESKMHKNSFLSEAIMEELF